MYLLNEFARKLGAKDKEKRKARLIKAAKIGAGIVGSTAILLGAKKLSNVGEKIGESKLSGLFLKKASKDIRNDLRNQIKIDRGVLKHSIKDLNPKSDIDQARNNLHINYLKQQQKVARKKAFSERISSLNDQKKKLGGMVGKDLTFLGTGIIPSTILANRLMTEPKKSKRK